MISYYFVQKLLSGKVVVNHRLLDVTSFTALFSLEWMNGKLYFYLCYLFLSKCLTQSLWQEGPANCPHETIYLFTNIEPSDCFISMKVLLNAQKRPHLWQQMANLKLQFAVCGWEKKPVVNPFPFEWVLRALLDFTLSNARRFYSSMGNLLDGKGLTTSKTLSLLTPSRSNECSGHL